MAGLVLSLLANLVSLVANVVVHITANEKMRFVCYRYTPTPTPPLVDLLPVVCHMNVPVTLQHRVGWLAGWLTASDVAACGGGGGANNQVAG